MQKKEESVKGGRFLSAILSMRSFEEFLINRGNLAKAIATCYEILTLSKPQFLEPTHTMFE